MKIIGSKFSFRFGRFKRRKIMFAWRNKKGQVF